ncbi:MAG: TetR/AcrR family transcriptional regulator [Inquilinus sp.]|nr:TetR/AcrR family transcriptional regulator [Inquilinus sp.]
MARRSDHSRGELRKMALAAAESIAEQEGARGLTAREVAGRIGYSVGTLYNLFGTLDDLIVEVNGTTLDALYDSLMEARRKADSDEPETVIAAFAAAYIDFIDRQPNRWDILFEHKLPKGRRLPNWYFEKLGRLLTLLDGSLAPLFAADQKRDRARAARVLWCGLHGICSLARSGKLGVVTGESVPDLTEALLTTYFAGLRARAR